MNRDNYCQIENIKKDLFRYYPEPYSFKVLLKGLLRSQGFKYTYFLRKSSTAKKGSLSYFFFRFIQRLFTYRYGFQIPCKATIGGGLYIGHFGTVIVSDSARIGENCNLSPGVTIGRDRRGERKGSPTIGDRVWIGTNAVVVGKIIIGNDVLIAPLTFVNFDVPSHSVVLGNPGKIIHKENPVKGFINNILVTH